MTDNGLGQKVATHASGTAVPDPLAPMVVIAVCPCPGSPHDHDEVYLAPEASMTMGLRANGAVAKAGGDDGLLEEYLGRVLIEEGVVGWTFTDDKGEVLPVNRTTIEKTLPWGKGGAELAERANDLYGKDILTPLVKRSLSTSGLGPTNGSTSPTRPSRSTRRSSSKSSSRASSAARR